MKKILFLSFLVTAAVATFAQSAGQQPFTTKSFAGKSIQQVVSKTSGGNITVSGGSGEAKVEVYVRGNNGRNELSNEEIQKRLDESYDLTVTVENGTLTASAQSKKMSLNWRQSLSISFRIYVPENVGTSLRTSGGNISLSNLSGTQDFTTSGGNLSVNSLTGKIKGRTSGGNISLKNTKDDINVSTSGGNIDADGCTGKLYLRTSGGNIDIDKLDGSIDASTSGGNIRSGVVSGDVFAHTSGGNVTLAEVAGSLDASTSGGHISATVTKIGSYVKVRNSGGNVDLQLPSGKGLDLSLSGDKVKVSKLSNFSGTVEDDHVDGKLNGGGVPVTVRGGRVSVTVK